MVASAMEETSHGSQNGVQVKDDIYLTGIAGYFPSAKSVKELEEKLFSKQDLITDDERRWKKYNPEIPQRLGKVDLIEKFDASFFDIESTEAHWMCPMSRMLLERVYECLIDAGVNPSELRGTNTGVFLGSCWSETEKYILYDHIESQEHGLTACSRAVCANKVSRWLGVHGPSYSVDTACSSSLYAMENAYKAIRDGTCDSAIVAGVNLCMHPGTSMVFARLGVLSMDGSCKSFDSRANGYVRSESIVACYLQKAKDSRRVYAKLVHAKTNCDGYKYEGITYPSGKVQQLLLEDFYRECKVDPSTVEFVEAHGTGTKVGDPEELAAIDSIFCKGRNKPLLLGSVKSNLGHSEASSGLNSVAKACIAYNTGYIPPNINFIQPRDDVPSLVEGRLKVVAEKTPWNRGLFALSSFGFGGANAHVLFENVARDQVNNGLPSDGIPRLVCVSGRTETAVPKILDSLESRPVDAEEVRLWHAIHERNIERHQYRGFTLLGSGTGRTVRLSRDVKHIPKSFKPPSVLFRYTELGAHWAEVAKQLVVLPAFAAALTRCSVALNAKGVNLVQLLNGAVIKQQELAVVGAAAVHIGLTDVLRELGIKPNYVISSQLGEICSSYANGRLSAEQAITSAYEFRSNFNSKRVLSTPQIDELVAKSSAENVVIVEVGFHSAQESLNNRDLTFVPLCTESGENVQFLLTAVGNLFNLGLNPLLANIYPTVQFPVAQATPMLSHLVEWDHSDDWTVVRADIMTGIKIPNRQREIQVDISDYKFQFATGHTIDGRVLFPGTGYLVLVWETFSRMQGRLYTEHSVEFEDVYLKRATNMPKGAAVNFVISIQENGRFELTENNITVVSGIIRNKEPSKQRAIESLDMSDIPATEIMSSRHFYKELNLRGYEYKGLFRSIESCSVDGTRGRITWSNSWVAFLDGLLQTSIVIQDTRLLYIPTRIEHLSIDTDLQRQYLESNSENILIPFRSYPNMDKIRCGGVELMGAHVVAISKKAPKGIPVYEKSHFIPNYCADKMTLEDILRSDLQLIHENMQMNKFKNVELVDEEYKSNDLKPLSEAVADVLADMPLVRADMTVLSSETLELPSNITVANNKISTVSNSVLFIGANLLQRPKVLDEALRTLQKGGFVLSRETTLPDTVVDSSSKYDILTTHDAGSEYIVLIREKKAPAPTKYIKIVTEDQTYSWIEEVKKELNNGENLVLYSENEPVNGLLGMVNCLRKEPGGETVRGLLIADPTAPKFNADCKFYKDHLDKGLGINVYKNGKWGTYRHLLLEVKERVPAAHAYVNIGTIGDLGSLKWWEGRHSDGIMPLKKKESLVQVYCSALNFRDTMTALGRVTVDAVARGRLAQDCVQGLEFAGKTENGVRVMGIGNRALANMVEADTTFLWPVRDEWTFEEAVTIPVAYGTVYLALVMIGKIKPGESILIHAGSGGVGQAAISVALHHGLEIFTTVGTPAKRAFIKRLFPQLKDSHIGNSRDTSFEKMIRRETNGKGVDLVLNSLADDKLQASVKCLKPHGRFLEIGKYDITMNSPIDMGYFKNDISFHGVMFDYMGEDMSIKLRTKLNELIMIGIETGAIRPLTHCTFTKNEIQAAYRYMSAGKHIGKVIVKIRDEDPIGTASKPKPVLIDAVPRYLCNENQVYIILGGLGGFGLELADWLIMRGARKVLMGSRRGLSNGYQALRIKHWRSYGAQIEISTHDVTTEKGCEDMLKMAVAMGPVRAIFNLAVVLSDAIFQNQTPETFAISFGPKAATTIHLDKLSRKLCPELRDFVIFSSVSCGRGNAGQTNYGFSNSVMERICEERKREGLPAVAIQWGAIGDVGLVADMQEENVQLEIGGTLQQRISSCLQAMDIFLKQDSAVVSSIVVAEKKAASSSTMGLVEVIAQILGISDMKTISLQAPLSEMGMDSVMAVEIKQTLERDYESFLTAQEIRLLTFAKLQKIAAGDSAPVEAAAKTVSSTANNVELELSMLVKNIGEEKQACKPYIYLPSNLNESDHIVFMIPGVGSYGNSFEVLSSRLNARTCALQFSLDAKISTLEQTVDDLYKTLKSQLKSGACSSYSVLAFSFGVTPLLEVTAKLEKDGYKGEVFCIDGSPEYAKSIGTMFDSVSDAALINTLICHTLSGIDSNPEIIKQLSKKLESIETLEAKVKFVNDFITLKLEYSEEFMVSTIRLAFNHLKMLVKLNIEKIAKLNSSITLIRTEKVPFACSNTLGLDKFTTGDVVVHTLDYNHGTILDAPECADIINKRLDELFAKSKKANRLIGTK